MYMINDTGIYKTRKGVKPNWVWILHYQDNGTWEKVGWTQEHKLQQLMKDTNCTTIDRRTVNEIIKVTNKMFKKEKINV